MDDLFSTPVARAGPNSGLLKRQSLAEPAGLSSTFKPTIMPSAIKPGPGNLQQSLLKLDQALGSPVQPMEDITRYLDMTRLNPVPSQVDFTMLDQGILQ